MRLGKFGRIEIMFNSWYRTLEFGPFREQTKPSRLLRSADGGESNKIEHCVC